MRTSILVVLAVSLWGCDVCSAKDESTFPNLQCFADGGAVVLRPRSFEGNATVTGQKCLSSVDGGVISLRLQGTVCAHPNQTVPYAAQLEADCAMGQLAPGTYTVGASSLTVLADGGVDLSHCDR